MINQAAWIVDIIDGKSRGALSLPAHFSTCCYSRQIHTFVIMLLARLPRLLSISRLPVITVPRRSDFFRLLSSKTDQAIEQQRQDLKKFIRRSMSQDDIDRASAYDSYEAWGEDEEWEKVQCALTEQAYDASDKSMSFVEFEELHEDEIMAATDSAIEEKIALYRKNDTIIENLPTERVREYTVLRRLLEQENIHIGDKEHMNPIKARGLVWTLEGVPIILCNSTLDKLEDTTEVSNAKRTASLYRILHETPLT